MDEVDPKETAEQPEKDAPAAEVRSGAPPEPEPPGEKTEAPSKGMGGLFSKIPKKALVMGGGALVILAASYFLVSGILRPNLNKLALEREAEAAKKEQVERLKKKQEEPPVGFNYTVDNVLVNPREPGARRFLRLGVAFEAESEPTVKELEAREMKIRDMLITMFSSRSLAELTDPVLKEYARKQLLEKVNAELSSGKVMNVYYTDYVIQ